MKKLVISLAVLLLAGIMIGCNTGSAEIKTYTDSTQQVEVGIDGEFIVALTSNPTTGYSWQESHDAASLNLVEKSYQQNEASKGLAGAGGTDYFRYRALKSGDTKITLVYKRPWEQASLADKTQEFSVRIK